MPYYQQTPLDMFLRGVADILHEPMILFAIALILLVVAAAAIADDIEKSNAAARQRAYQAQQRAAYERQLAELAQQEQLCLAELAAIEAEAARDQAWARAAFLQSLTVQERALLEMRLRASAEAEARARYRLDQLTQENRQLTQRLRALGWNG